MGAVDFDTMFTTMHDIMMLRAAFGPIYFKGSKCFLMVDKLDLLGFRVIKSRCAPLEGEGRLVPSMADTDKNAILENACAGLDDDLQFRLSSDASKTGTGGVLFQLKGVTAEKKHLWPSCHSGSPIPSRGII